MTRGHQGGCTLPSAPCALHRFARRPVLLAAVTVLVLASTPLGAQRNPGRSDLTQSFVSVDAPVVVLKHARVIDGTGGAPIADRLIIISNGTISYVGDSAGAPAAPNARVLDLAGHTVVPGFVGLHDHMYYSPLGELRTSMMESGPRLYLAGGVTTIRTAGAFFPYDELAVKHAIDQGEVPGPNIHVSVSILGDATRSGSDPAGIGIAGISSGNRPVATTPEQARRVVDYWVDEGVTWFGEQLPGTRELMGAVIARAHQRGARVTGHICSVTHREAVALGIDNLEHGLITATDYLPDKQPDVCPPNAQRSQANVDVRGEAVRTTFRIMLDRQVAMTSTLSTYEQFVPGRPLPPAMEAMVLEALAPKVVPAYHRWRDAVQNRTGEVSALEPELFKNMLRYDREFFVAGGVLAAGVDPWGSGVLPGYGNQRNYELLIEAGFTPGEAIKVLTANGAMVLGSFDRYGSITVGKRADLGVIKGDPATRPSDIYQVTLVFKDGLGYDSARLRDSVRGLVGIR